MPFDAILHRGQVQAICSQQDARELDPRVVEGSVLVPSRECGVHLVLLEEPVAFEVRLAELVVKPVKVVQQVVSDERVFDSLLGDLVAPLGSDRVHEEARDAVLELAASRRLRERATHRRRAYGRWHITLD